MPKAVSLFLIRYGKQFAARNVRYWGQSGRALLHRICPLMTQTRQEVVQRTCPLSESKADMTHCTTHVYL
jgi:hypothetical protein